MARCTLDIFLNNEHLGYNCTLSHNEEFLVIRLEVSKTYAERILFYLLKRNMIAYEPFFQVNLSTIPSMFHDRYVIIKSTDDRSGNPAIPSDKVVPAYKIDKQLYEAYHQGLSGTPEKIQVLGKIAAEQGLLGQVNAAQSNQAKSIVPASQIPPVIPPVVVKQEFQDLAQTPVALALPRFRPSSDVPTTSPPLLNFTAPLKKLTPLRIPGYSNFQLPCETTSYGAALYHGRGTFSYR